LSALCLSDLEICPVETPLRSGFVYVRRYGPAGGYSGNYSERLLKKDAKNVREWLEKGRTAYVYCNNDVEGHAVRNALRRKELVRR
jgi:uncharacterized protein YecE (DUF72 family)